MKTSIFLSAIVCGAMLVACDKAPQSNDIDNVPTDSIPDEQDEHLTPDDESYHAVQLSGAVTHVQPMCGMVLWNEQASSKHNTHGSCISLEFSYVPPCKVVTGKSGGNLQYDWSFLDNKLAGAASRGHQMVVRFPLCYPSNRDNCVGTKGATYVPDYIKSLSGYTETYSANPGGDGPTYYPDWSNEELQWFVKQFYVDLNAHYANDPRLAFVEVGFGHWGEYHTYGTVVKFGKNFPTRDYQRQFFKHLASVMSLPWLVSIDAGDGAYFVNMADDAELKNIAFGLFDDSFMHKEHDKSQGDGWNEQCWLWSGMERWKKGVCGGEISYYTSNDQRSFLNPAGMYGVTWEQAAAKYHMSFIICNDAPSGSYFTAERVTEAGIASGYKFTITSCTTNGVESHVTVENTGIAPLYRDAYVTVDGTRAKKSLRGLLPGESKRYDVQAVAADGNVKITSDNILPTQEIQYEVKK